jgi:hypothetical protein
MPTIEDLKFEADRKNSILENAHTMRPGKILRCAGDYYFFARERRLGVAVSIGSEYTNVRNLHPVKNFYLDCEQGLLHTDENFLTLTVDRTEFDITTPMNAYLFAEFMMRFVDLRNGNRERLVSNPRDWAETTASLIGNETSDTKPYPYVAELLLFNQLTEAGLLRCPATEWRGPEAGVHDFELANCSIEVKSHLHADGKNKPNEVVISSMTQLRKSGNKPLYLIFFKMEETGDISLESCVGAARQYHAVIIEKLGKQGLVEGDHSWPKAYHLLGEPQVYEIKEDFPRITEEMFKGDKIPSGITKLIYHVSLQNIPSCNLKDFLVAIKNGALPLFSVSDGSFIEK